MNRHFFPAVILLALTILVPVVEAQQPGDEVVSMVEAVALAAGRLLPAAILGGDTSSAQGSSLAVGEIVHDGTTPPIAGLLRSIVEEELLGAADSFRGRIPLEVVSSPEHADLVVRIRSVLGAQSVLFSIQLVDSSGRILAASRVSRPLSRSIQSALVQSVYSGNFIDGDYDPPETPEQAWALDVNSVETGLRLRGNDDTDWFSVDVPSRTTTEMDGERGRIIPGISVFTSGTTDTYIEVYGPNDVSTLIAENDDGADMNALVSFPVSDGGRFWIKVRGFSTATEGAYDLNVQTVTLELDAYEPNDSLQAATPLADLSLPLRASIRPGGDRDWYYLSADILRKLSAEPTDVAVVAYTQGIIDTVMSLYDRDGEEIVYNDDGGEETNARIVIPSGLEEAYLEVQGFGGTEGDYILEVEAARIEHDEYEPDDTPENASLLQWDTSPQRRTFSSESDVDWVRLFVPEGPGQRISVETFGDMDTYMTLYDENRREIAYSDDDGYGMNARIDRQLNPGTYLLEIRSLYLSELGAEYALEGRLR